MYLDTCSQQCCASKAKSLAFPSQTQFRSKKAAAGDTADFIPIVTQAQEMRQKVVEEIVKKWYKKKK